MKINPLSARDSGYRKDIRSSLTIRLLNLNPGLPFTCSAADDDWGNRMEGRCTRRALRHSVVIDVEVFDLESGIQIRERTKDLSLYGCSVSTVIPFQKGTKVALKMTYGEETITAFGNVIYSRPDIGMGIVFTIVEQKDQEIIAVWIAELAIPQ